MNKSESISKLATALVKAQKSMGDATKGSKNPFFKSSYADLNAIREVAIPALNLQGVAVLQPTVTTDGKNYVQTVLLHESGEFISGTTQIVNAKGDAQGEGSGISYARRYGLQSLLNIGAVDDDGEAAVGRVNAKPVQTATVSSSNGTGTTNGTTGQETKNETPKTTKTETKSAESTSPKASTKELIKTAFKTLETQKKVTLGEFKTKYLSGIGLSAINDTQASIALIKIKSDFPGVIV